MAQAARQLDAAQQLPLRRTWTHAAREEDRRGRTTGAPLCAGCREREARYGFRPEEAEGIDDRPSTLCFECFRMEVGRRQAVAERMARGWNAKQVQLPLEDTLRALDRRRRRAQIAARHALGAH